MEHECKTSVKDEPKDSSIFSRNSSITEVLQFVFSHPEFNKEMQNMLLNFWDEYENCVSEDKEYCEFDVLCMYALYYAYTINGPTQSAVSRSFHCYLTLLNSGRSENRNDIITCTDYPFLRALQEFSNCNSVEEEDFLAYAFTKCFLGRQFGFSLFLVKFGLIEFPSEANEKSRKIVEILVYFFNDMLSSSGDEDRPEENRITIQLDDLFNQMQQNKNENFRRLIFVFCYICIIAEYEVYEKLEMRYYNGIECFKDLKLYCYEKSKCLYLFIEMTTEVMITVKDIDKFLSEVLNNQINDAVRISLLETTRKMFSEMHYNYNPRSLKHLVRCKIRECLRNSAVLPESVYQLPIPVDLKGFIAFEEKEIWKTLKNDQNFINFKSELFRGRRRFY